MVLFGKKPVVEDANGVRKTHLEGGGFVLTATPTYGQANVQTSPRVDVEPAEKSRPKKDYLQVLAPYIAGAAAFALTGTAAGLLTYNAQLGAERKAYANGKMIVTDINGDARS